MLRRIRTVSRGCALATLYGTLSIGCSGCGLLFLPTVEAFPAPVRHVSVRDARTDAPISTASVELGVVGVSTKAALFQPEGTYPSDPDGGVSRLAVTPDGDGGFAPHGTLRLALWQCLFPLFSWSTPGDWWYYGHKNRIRAEAPGYRPACVEYPAGSSPGRDVGEGALFSKGVLTLRLTPCDAPPPGAAPP